MFRRHRPTGYIICILAFLAVPSVLPAATVSPAEQLAALAAPVIVQVHGKGRDGKESGAAVRHQGREGTSLGQRNGGSRWAESPPFSS